jgi:WD40 repeat protein/tRNA A-37 threonylcarbamoyl transferase component Bud32
MITISCSGCQQQLDIREELIGQTVECPTCKARLHATAGPPPAVAGPDTLPTVPPRPQRAGEANGSDISATKDYGQATVPPGSPAVDGAPGRPGEVHIQGYEMQGVLGRGGMGVVYQARHVKLNRRVALKMILAGSHAGEQELARFQTEAQAIARLQHPNIVQVHEVGEHEGKPFFSLEFCGGGSLAQKLAGTPLPAREAAALVETLARAMQAAHEHNVIHRDLKPANVLLTEDGVPKITDFGLAKKLDEAGQTQTGAIVGTPSYMPPEQAEGQASGTGPLADVYALGAILYECLTGRPPFKAATSLETVLQVVSTEPVPPMQLQPKTPRDLETICLKCLAKEPHRRYPTALALAEDLRRFQAGEPIRARPVGTFEKAVKWARRRPAIAGLAAAVVLVTLAGIGAFAWAFAETVEARDDAITARNNEEIERKNAENARDGLAHALTETEEARAHAETERGKADTARIKAELAEKERARQLWLAERFLYNSQFREAYSQFQSQNLVACRLVLDQTHWDLRGPEYGYLVNQLNSKWRLVSRHGSIVHALVVVPSGKKLISASSDRTIKVWDLQRGEETHILRGDGSGFNDLAVSPDGKRLYSRDQLSTVKEWDLATGQETRTLFAHPDVMVAKIVAAAHCRLALSPDASHLAALIEPPPFSKGKDSGSLLTDQIKVWNLHTGKEAFTLSEPMNSVGNLAFAADGKRLISTSSKGSEIKVWDVETGKQIVTLRDTVGFGTMAIAPDGKRLFLAVVNTPDIHAWDLEAKTHKVLRGHAELVRSLAVSPDGKRLGSGSYDGFIKIWDLTSDKEIASLHGQPDGVESLTFSPDGRRLFVGGLNGSVMDWTLDSRDNYLPLIGIAHTGQVIRFLLTPDGKTLVTGGMDRIIKVWDLQGKKPMLTLRGHTAEIRDLAVAPDGQRLYSSGGDVKVWDLGTGKELATLPLPRIPANPAPVLGLPSYLPGSLVLAADGKRLFSAGTDAITVWDLDAGKEALTLAEPRALKLAVSPDGTRLFAATMGQTIHVWDLQTGKRAFSLNGHGVAARPNRPQFPLIHALAVSADSKRLFSAGSDRTIKVWDTHTGEDLMTLRGHTDDVASLAVPADGRRLFSGSLDQTIILWDLELRREILTLRGQPAHIAALALTHDGKRLLSMSSRPMALDLDPGQEIATLRGHRGAVESLVLTPDGSRLISAGADRTTRVWEIQTGTEIQTLGPEQPGQQEGGSRSQGGGSIRLAISADGQRLFAGRGKSIQMWDLREGKEPRTFPVDAKLGVSCLALSADGQRLFAGSSEGIKVWDTETGKEVSGLESGMKRVSCLALSPDGSLFAAGMEAPAGKAPDGRGLQVTIKAWDLKTGKECLSLAWKDRVGVVASLVLSPDGQRLFVGSGDSWTETGEITEWDLKTGKQARRLSGQLAPVQSMLLSADGQRLVSGDGRGAIVIWDLGTGTAIRTLRGHQGGVLGLAMTADGRRLFSASGDHTIKVWDVAADLPAPVPGR